MTDTWTWADFEQQHGYRPEPRKPLCIGGTSRPSGGALSRFVGTTHHADRDQAALPPYHPAIEESRTLFPRSVVAAADAPRLLVSGHNSAKLGKTVMRGPWVGLPIYQLTLEERATCPRSCTLWRECFGNAMPFARRHAHGPDLEDRLADELYRLSQIHPAGFVVRLHVLGDFYSLEYAEGWAMALDLLPGLRIFGYTAHPASSEIGQAITAANDRHPTRCAIRFSVGPDTPAGPMQATTIWRQARGRQPEGIVCPAQTGNTIACATCGLCWLPQAAHLRIAFIGHGKRGRPRVRKAEDA